MGLTQAEVADRLNATPPYVSGLETGRANLTVGQLAAIADALEVELSVAFKIPDRRPEPEIPIPPI